VHIHDYVLFSIFARLLFSGVCDSVVIKI
jgi:hypothetical protein